MKSIFDVNGKFYAVCSGIVDMACLSLLWYLCCLPVVTVIPASAALYYATVKSIRYDRGKAIAEYGRLFRSTIKPDILFSSLSSILFTGMLFAVHRLFRPKFLSRTVLLCGTCLGLLLLLFLAVLLWRIVAGGRFRERSTQQLQLAYVLALRYLPQSAVMILLLLAALLLAYIMPPLLIILPSLAAFCASFIAEPVLKKYIPAEFEPAERAEE